LIYIHHKQLDPRHQQLSTKKHFGLGNHAVPEMRLRFVPEADGELESPFCGPDAAGFSGMGIILCLWFEQVNCLCAESVPAVEKVFKTGGDKTSHYPELTKKSRN
jgi:hypothetical protein